jgi:hypothetical protein
MELLEKCGPTRTSGALQLEPDVIGSVKYQYNFAPGSAGRAQIGARIAELSQNPSVQTNPWSLVTGSIYGKMVMLIGITPPAWADGKKVDVDSVLKGMRLWHNQAMPLMQSACDNAQCGWRSKGDTHSTEHAIDNTVRTFMQMRN